MDLLLFVKMKDLYKYENLKLIHQSYRYFPPEYNSFYLNNYKNLNIYINENNLYQIGLSDPNKILPREF